MGLLACAGGIGCSSSAATAPEEVERAAAAGLDPATTETRRAPRATVETTRQGALAIPEWWPGDTPLPRVRSNCMRCHLTSGRELTLPLVDLAGSIHDREELSCDDCHGGNTRDDATAHEEAFHFVGNSLRDLMAACADCHTVQAKAVAKGSHFWDLNDRVNPDYPFCLDCHGHHDVGRPPAEFSLALVCEDCHDDFGTKMPLYAAIVSENDRLWEVLREVNAGSGDTDHRVPGTLRGEIDSVRAATARLMHPARPLESDRSARSLVARTAKLREALRSWLARGAQGSSDS